MPGFDFVLLARFALLNIAGLAALGVAQAYGLVGMALSVDTTGLTALIAAVFCVGLGIAGVKAWRMSRDINAVRSGAMPAEFAADDEESLRLRLFHRINAVRNTSNILVLLGLVGTVLGIIIALGGVDPATVGDISKIGPMVATLVKGMSTALYTTLVGSVLSIWISLNYNLLAGGAVKLILAVRRRK